MANTVKTLLGSAMNWSDGRKELQKISPEKVVDSWGSEKADYDYANNSCTPGKMCGHYTQMVWRATTTVGCARQCAKTPRRKCGCANTSRRVTGGQQTLLNVLKSW